MDDVTEISMHAIDIMTITLMKCQKRVERAKRLAHFAVLSSHSFFPHQSIAVIFNRTVS